MTVEDVKNLFIGNQKDYVLLLDYYTGKFLDWTRVEFMDCIPGYENAAVCSISSKCYIFEDEDEIYKDVIKDLNVDLSKNRDLFVTTIYLRRK